MTCSSAIHPSRGSSFPAAGPRRTCWTARSTVQATSRSFSILKAIAEPAGAHAITKIRLDNACLNMYIRAMASATAPSPRKARRRFDSPQQEAFLNLWRTYDRMRLLEERLFDRHDLTPQQYNALRLLKAAHPQSIPTLSIASRLISRAPDITRLLDKLHDRKLIERTRPADNRRTVMISIAPAGVELLNRLAL